jgi:hypothetical protein
MGFSEHLLQALRPTWCAILLAAFHPKGPFGASENHFPDCRSHFCHRTYPLCLSVSTHIWAYIGTHSEPPRTIFRRLRSQLWGEPLHCILLSLAYFVCCLCICMGYGMGRDSRQPGKSGFWVVRTVGSQENRDSGWCGWSAARKIGILGGADGRQLGKLGFWVVRTVGS